MPVSAPAPSSSSSTAAWNGGRAALAEVRGPDRDGGALLDLAVRADHAAGAAADQLRRAAAPRGRPRASPPAPPRCVPEANTIARSHGSPPSACAGRGAASSAASRASPAVERPVPIRTDIRHRRYSAPCRAPDHRRDLRADRASARPRWRSRSPSGCAPTARTRSRSRPTRCSSTAGLEILTGAPTAAERARLEHRLVGTLPLTGDLQRRRVRARRAHAEIDALLGRAGGRSSSAAPACTCAPRSPSSTCARPSTRAIRERRRAQLERARRARAARGAGRARARDRRRDPPARTPSASPARSSCSTPATSRRPAPRPRAVDGRAAPPDAAGRPHDGPRGARRAASRRASTRWSPPGPREEVRAADAAGASPRRAPGARLPGSCSTATSRR